MLSSFASNRFASQLSSAISIYLVWIYSALPLSNSGIFFRRVKNSLCSFQPVSEDHSFWRENFNFLTLWLDKHFWFVRLVDTLFSAICFFYSIIRCLFCFCGQTSVTSKTTITKVKRLEQQIKMFILWAFKQSECCLSLRIKYVSGQSSTRLYNFGVTRLQGVISWASFISHEGTQLDRHPCACWCGPLCFKTCCGVSPWFRSCECCLLWPDGRTAEQSGPTFPLWPVWSVCFEDEMISNGPLFCD